MGRKLINEKELEWSAVVANNSMNRERVAVGVNSYEKDLKWNPITYLKKLQTDSPPRWTDLCCGSGNALIQAAKTFENLPGKTQPILHGIDLVGFFSPHENSTHLQLQQLSLSNWRPKNKSELITCVHGLHYLGDKLELILRAISHTKSNGLFVANLDINNIKLEGIKDANKTLKQFFKENGISYNSRTKLISSKGLQQPIEFPFRYLGADDQAGPNYTGQPVVDSYYRLT